MAMVQYSLCAILFLALFSHGMSQGCDPETISIDQQETGRMIKGKPEFEVIVINICDCQQRNVTLDCDGFQTVEDPDPNKVKKSGFSCLLLKGNSIVPNIEVDFTYAWDEQFPFTLLSSIPECP